MRVLTLLVGLVTLYLLLSVTRTVWGTFLVAFALAYLLNPLVTWLERHRFRRFFGVALVLLVFALLLVFFWSIGRTIAMQLPNFVALVPELVEQVQAVPFAISRSIDPTFGEVFRQVSGAIETFLDRLAEDIIPTLIEGGMETGLMSRVVALMGGGFRISIAFVLMVYLLYKFPGYSRSFLSVFPARRRPWVAELLAKANHSVGGYVRGQLIIAGAVGLLSYIGLTLVGVPFAPGLGLLATIFNLIPYFGPLAVSVPALLLAMTVSWGSVLAAALVLLGANAIDAYVLTPVILSRTIKVDPVTVIIAILLGSSLFGLVGAVIAVPSAVFLKLLYIEYYVQSDWYRRGAEAQDEAALPEADEPIAKAREETSDETVPISPSLRGGG